MRLPCLVLCSVFALSAEASDPGPRGDRIVIDTRARTLTVFAGEEVLGQFPVSFGQGGFGKRLRGDGKNPVGTYRLMKGRPSKFHRFLPVAYPNAEDADRAEASKPISHAEAESIRAAVKAGRMPPQDTALGGAIGVHGLGRVLGIDLGPLQALHRYFDATEGCFLLTDHEVDALEALYKPGAVLEVR